MVEQLVKVVCVTIIGQRAKFRFDFAIEHSIKEHNTERTISKRRLLLLFKFNSVDVCVGIMGRFGVVLGLCVVIVASVLAESTPPGYCCAPDQYVTFLGQVNGLVVAGKGTVQFKNILIASDFTNMRVGEFIQTTTMGFTSNIQVIIDFKQNYMYTIVGNTTCTKTAAMGAFDKCVPQNAKFMGTYSMGAGTNMLTFNSFSVYFHVPGVLEGNMTLGITNRGKCIPVSVTIVGQTLGATKFPILSLAGYSNVTMGISNPGRFFNIPAICQKAPQRSERSVAENEESDDIHNMVAMLNALIHPHRK